jgi:hypothetical protein
MLKVYLNEEIQKIVDRVFRRASSLQQTFLLIQVLGFDFLRLDTSHMSEGVLKLRPKTVELLSRSIQ